MTLEVDTSLVKKHIDKAERKISTNLGHLRIKPNYIRDSHQVEFNIFVNFCFAIGHFGVFLGFRL